MLTLLTFTSCIIFVHYLIISLFETCLEHIYKFNYDLVLSNAEEKMPLLMLLKQGLISLFIFISFYALTDNWCRNYYKLFLVVG